MRLLFFTLFFIATSLTPPVFKIGVFHTDSGHLVFSTTYLLFFLVVSFCFIHEFIHVFSHDDTLDEFCAPEHS